MIERKTILFIYPHFRPYMEDRWVPTSLVFLAAPLKAAGYRPILVDDRFSREQTLSILDEHLADALLVGITTATGSQLKNARELAYECKIRRPDVPIVFGGPFPSAKPHLMLSDPNVDSVVLGQGENSLLWLCNEFSYGIKEPMPVRVSHLPPLPYFDRDFIHIEDYLNPDTMAINYATSSGCVGNCGFCYWHPSYRYSWFPVDRVVGDLKALKDEFGIRNIQFDDGTLFVGRRRTMALCEAMLNAKLDIEWRANARIDTLKQFTLQDMQIVAGSGCRVIHIGLEHASPRILWMMNKRINPEGCFSLLSLAKLSGVRLRFHILLGNPGETLEDLYTVGDLVQKLLDWFPDQFDYTVNWFTPYPGCAMTGTAKWMGYEEPMTLEGFEKLELVNYVNLPEDDRQIVKESSPWEVDYRVPWFDEQYNAVYMEEFRRVIPEIQTIETTDRKRETVYE